MTDKEMLDREREELNQLIGRGMAIELDVVEWVRADGIKGILGRRVKRTERKRFVINQLTLTTLDLISAEQIELQIDEEKMQSEDGMGEAKRLAARHSRRMARILALAVLGQDYAIPIQKSGNRTTYRYDDRRLDELTDLFFHNVKPSHLLEYAMMITTMSNLGDFINSIRLMSAARTTMPILVEEGKEA